MLQFVLALVSAGLESVEEHLEDADNITAANGYLEGTERVQLGGSQGGWQFRKRQIGRAHV